MKRLLWALGCCAAVTVFLGLAPAVSKPASSVPSEIKGHFTGSGQTEGDTVVFKVRVDLLPDGTASGVITTRTYADGAWVRQSLEADIWGVTGANGILMIAYSSTDPDTPVDFFFPLYESDEFAFNGQWYTVTKGKYTVE